jgi:quercetin dioxygenase-like cupin family protein
MLRAKPINSGNLAGIIYDFPEAGDVLPMHTHTEADVHISIVARGAFRAHGNGWERVVNAGDVLDWRANDPHEFVALDAGARLVNIVKGHGAAGTDAVQASA